MTQEMLGMRVEATGDDRAPYILHGKRGATYGLLRYPTSRKMHAINLRNAAGAPVSIQGNSEFSDSDGELVPVTWRGY